jgi:hypothetical protein
LDIISAFVEVEKSNRRGFDGDDARGKLPICFVSGAIFLGIKILTTELLSLYVGRWTLVEVFLCHPYIITHRIASFFRKIFCRHLDYPTPNSFLPQHIPTPQCLSRDRIYRSLTILTKTQCSLENLVVKSQTTSLVLL